MPKGLIENDRFLLAENENAIWDAYDRYERDFPLFTIYDRPSLMLSNLLRGDIDAATRAMLTPQSLTPAEMRTLSSYVLKGASKKNKIAKVLVDIFTNPLVLIAVLMTIKYPLKEGTKAVYAVGKGLAGSSSKPGPISSLAMGAFGNLRNIPNAFRTYMAWAIDTGNFIVERSEELIKVVRSVLGINSDGWYRISAYLQGFHKAVKPGVTLGPGGLRHAAYYVYKIRPREAPIWPGLTKIMSKDELRVARGIRRWLDKFWELISKDKKAFKLMKAEMELKGIHLGDRIEDYFPIFARYSQLEGAALYERTVGAKDFHFAMDKMIAKIASGFQRRVGPSIGRISQLRRMERLGMPPIVDDLLRATGGKVAEMEELLRMVWNGAAPIADPKKRAAAFAKGMLEIMKGRDINFAARLGSGDIAKGALRKAAERIAAASGDPARLEAQFRTLAEVLGMPAQYDMRPTRALTRYITTMGSTYTWHLAPAGLVGQVKKAGGYKRLITPLYEQAEGSQLNYMKDQLTVMMRGLKPHRAYHRAAAFGELKNRLYTWVTQHDLPKKLLPPSTQEWLKRYFLDFSSISSESIGAKISEYFYLSTLGLNISPTSKNLLQNVITLLHVPGINMTGLSAGIREAAKRSAEYVSLLAKGKSRTEAFRTAFPDYVEFTGKAAGLTKAMGAGDVALEGRVMPRIFGSVYQKIKDVMYTPFSTSEGFNRVIGFYVGKHSHLATGASLEESSEFGAMINQICHFPGGPLGMPKALLGMWGPARQFMHFPLRYMGFLMGLPTLTGATGLARYRPLATVVGGSAALYTAVKGLLGVDISKGLMWGALPFPQYESAPFYPWPLVPPLFQLGGVTAKAVATGEFEPLLGSAALLVPSGIALRKLYKTLGRKYADYEHRTPDGRIPVYNEKHALIGTYSPWQLTMRSLGLSPVSEQAEYSAARWLLAQREKIRTFRRDFLEALADNDIGKAMSINEEFQRAYPELGPMRLKKSDITAIRNRREISRIHRILRGFPKAYQPLFGHMVREASLGQMIENIEQNPRALETFSPLLQSLER